MAQYISTLAILKGVEAFITGLKLTDAPDSEPLFQLVRLYDSTDVNKAFADVTVSRQQRLCFILPGGTRFSSRLEGAKLASDKRVNFALLICDTDRKTGQAAVFSGPRNVGTIDLSDRTIEALAGEQLGIPGVVLEPEDGDDITVTKAGDSDSGRKGWFQPFGTRAGAIAKSIARI